MIYYLRQIVNVTSLPEEAVTAIYPKQQHLNIFVTIHIDISSVTGRPIKAHNRRINITLFFMTLKR